MWYHVYRVYYVISSVSIDWNFAIASAQLLMVSSFSSIGYMKYHALSLYILWKPNAAISTLCVSIFCLSYIFERKLESRNIDAKNLKREKVWARKYRNMYIYKKVEIYIWFSRVDISRLRVNISNFCFHNMLIYVLYYCNIHQRY